MGSLGPADALPGNLSDQQLFVLALLATSSTAHLRYSRLSWMVAEEFDERDGCFRIFTRGFDNRRRGFGAKRRQLTSYHTTSLSRTVKRLEERGYLDRIPSRPSRHGTGRTWRVAPTEKGIRAGREAIRRHQDGRYNLEFSTLSEFDVELPD